MEAPNVNGIMTFSKTKETAIRKALVAIRDAFVPNDIFGSCDTLYIVSEYNKFNVGAEINGDTAESILAGE